MIFQEHKKKYILIFFLIGFGWQMSASAISLSVSWLIQITIYLYENQIIQELKR